jgi:5,10-methylenetetrahydrofolate reductase
VANPEADPLEPQLIKVAKKIKAGASFLVTHPVFDVQRLKRLTESVKSDNIKVLAGVRLLIPEEVSKYREGGYPGLFVPDNILGEVETGDMGKCMEIAGRLIKDIKSANLCNGVYISAPGHEEMIQDLLRA